MCFYFLRKKYCFIATKYLLFLFQGDAGGPLYCGSGKTLKKNKTSIGYLIGIVSGSGEERNQGVIYFTRVSAFKRFIRRNDATQLAEYSFYSFHNNFMICYYLALIMSLH